MVVILTVDAAWCLNHCPLIPMKHFTKPPTRQDFVVMQVHATDMNFVWYLCFRLASVPASYRTAAGRISAVSVPASHRVAAARISPVSAVLSD